MKVRLIFTSTVLIIDKLSLFFIISDSISQLWE